MNLSTKLNSITHTHHNPIHPLSLPSHHMVAMSSSASATPDLIPTTLTSTTLPTLSTTIFKSSTATTAKSRSITPSWARRTSPLAATALTCAESSQERPTRNPCPFITYRLESLTMQGLASDSRLMIFDLEDNKEKFYTPDDLYHDYFDIL